MNINILSPFVADLIAAGEVVERPSSVVKELLENAIDAGAKSITLELKNGGMTYIRVTDDGCGMPPEDAGIAFLRHATSKLNNPQDLEAIGTLGFRGEALAAISAVSRIELLTRECGMPTGTRVTLESGEIQEMGEHGCPEGTTMIVRDLFYNTPARLKFIKSDRSEAQSCINLALKCALGHPEVSIRCIRDGKEEFFSPGDGRSDSAVYTLLGRDFAGGLLSCDGENDGVRVHGFCSSPRTGRGNRGMQFFFCNGRAIKSATMQAALEQAYKNSLLTGRFPACVLYLELSRAAVDVNVHPTKAEVKFSNDRLVFDVVYHAVLSALEAERTVPAPALNRPEPRRSFTPDEQEPAKSGAPRSPGGKMISTPPPRPAQPVPKPDFFQQLTTDEFKKNYTQEKMELHSPRVEYGTKRDTVTTPKTVSPPISEANPMENNDFILVGEALSTYIIVQTGEDMVLIDKHAAHERIIFDRLKTRETDIMSQNLLIPVTFSPGMEDTAMILENAALLAEFGFEIEPYGSDSIVLRSIPSDTEITDARPMLEELCEKLRLGRSVDASEAKDELLYTVACKAAIKAGKNSSPEELKKIAGRVLTGEIKYCPHGRPVSVTMTKKELDKLFKRIV